MSKSIEQLAASPADGAAVAGSQPLLDPAAVAPSAGSASGSASASATLAPPSAAAAAAAPTSASAHHAASGAASAVHSASGGHGGKQHQRLNDEGPEPTPLAPKASGGLRGSRANLLGSRGNLLSTSKWAGSRNMLNSRRNDEEPSAPVMNYENTYQVKPEKKPMAKELSGIAHDTLQRLLTNVKYDGQTVETTQLHIANEIMAAAKALQYPRHKYIVEVVVSEFQSQGIKVSSRALWDASTDEQAAATFQNSSLSAVAMVFACYFE